MNCMRRYHSRGFSLVELLAAMSVLTILGLLIVQTIDAVSRTVASSSRKIDAISEGRLVFQNLSRDFQKMARRPDIAYRFTNATAGSDPDSLRFYSEVPALLENPSGSTALQRWRLAVVGYRMEDSPDDGKPALKRGLRGIQMEEGPDAVTGNHFMGLIAPGGNSAGNLRNTASIDDFAVAPLWTIPDANYDLISPGVFRFEICWQLADGALLANPPTRTAGGVSIVDVTEISAMYVAIAVLDSDTRKKLSKTQIESMAAALPSVQNGETPLQAWSDYIDGTNTLPGPPILVGGVKYFQQCFPLQ